MDVVSMVGLHAIVGIAGLRLAVIDLAEHRLPDRITAPLAAAVLVWALVFGERGTVARALGEAFLTAGIFALLAYLPSRPLGLGDVKLQASLGFYAALVVHGGGVAQAVGSFVLGGVAAGTLLVSGKIGPQQAIPFGPFMVAAAFLVGWWGETGKII
jgi:leader peptidase (prepilin peptidase)/N-methyltransferase